MIFSFMYIVAVSKTRDVCFSCYAMPTWQQLCFLMKNLPGKSTLQIRRYSFEQDMEWMTVNNGLSVDYFTKTCGP